MYPLDNAVFRVSWTKRAWPFLTTPTEKSLNQLLIFLNLYQHAKNQFLPSVHSSDTVNFRVSSTNWPFLFLTILTPKIFNHFLICVNLCQHAKKSVNFICSFWYSQFQSPETRLHWPDLFLTMLNQKIFYRLLIFVNLYQHAKDGAVSSTCVGETAI